MTGTGTLFTTELARGNIIRFNTESRSYRVASITNDTALVLTSNYRGTTAAGKTVKRAKHEFMYLTAETFDIDGADKLVDLNLFGNDSTVLEGDGSTNLAISLGGAKLTIRVGGFIVPIQSTQAPTLTSPDTHVLSGSQTLGNVLGEDIRHALLEYWANQFKVGTGTGQYTSFYLLYPRWKASLSPRYFQGLMSRPRFGEVQGEPDQYMFSFDFMIGRVTI